MSPERIVLYGMVAVIAISAAIMVVRAPVVGMVGLGAVDWVLTRGALVAAVCLLWRLVRAVERRVALAERRAEQRE